MEFSPLSMVILTLNIAPMKPQMTNPDGGVNRWEKTGVSNPVSFSGYTLDYIAIKFVHPLYLFLQLHFVLFFK